MTSASPGRPRACLAGVASIALGLVMTLSGCSSADGPRSPAATPEEALHLAGLQLPNGAVDVTFEDATSADSPLLEHYRVQFTAPRKQAVDFCASGDLGGDLPALDLTGSEQQRLGVQVPSGEDARLCASQQPQDISWDRIVLIEGDDPARVIVSLGRMGR